MKLNALIENYTGSITKTNEELTLKVAYLQSTITATERKYKELENIVKSQIRLADRSMILQERRLESKLSNLRSSILNLEKKINKLDK